MALGKPFLDQVSLPAVFLLADGTAIVVRAPAEIVTVPQKLAYLERQDLRFSVYEELKPTDER